MKIATDGLSKKVRILLLHPVIDGHSLGFHCTSLVAPAKDAEWL